MAISTVSSISAIAPPALTAPDVAASAPGRRGALWKLLQSGQLLEISGTGPGKLSTAVRVLLAAQAEGETTAWVAPREGSWFFPPDFADAGVDLNALLVVRVPQKAELHGCMRAAELLLRSGAWGLIVLDLSGAGRLQRSVAWQSRLSALARAHAARVVLLTASSSQEPSLGPLISLRIEPSWALRSGSQRAVLTPQILKNKLGTSFELPSDDCQLPAGAVL